MIAFGPVPSRRLGKSLGINNIPAKICSYACVYCQIGRTIKMSVERKAFYEPEEVFEEALKKSSDADYITFVPDGEPTLDVNIGKEIEMLKSIKKIAVLTNSSLIWREDVQYDLMDASLISFKIDAVSQDLWKKINRPYPSLNINEILDAMLDFSKKFKGRIITETMLIDGINYENEFDKIASFLKKLKPYKAYVAIPTRPPVEPWVKPAKEDVIIHAYQVFSKVVKAEYLIGYEGNEFSSTGDIENDLLSITSVHPMRQEAVDELLKKNGSDWNIVEKMVSEGKLLEISYEGNKFYMRKIPKVRA